MSISNNSQMINSQAAEQEADMRLSPLLTVRPEIAGQQSDTVVISDAWNRRRVRVKRQALLNLVTQELRLHPERTSLGARLQASFPGGRALDRVSTEHILHWLARGWHPSLEYYLWSRDAAYVDTSDPDGRQRRELLQQYLAQSSLPPRLEPAGKHISLPEPQPLPASVSLGQLLMERKTFRHYLPERIRVSTLSSVLWFGLDEVRRVRQRAFEEDALNYFRSYGSAFDFYVVAYTVEGLSPGVYFYHLEKHHLVQIREGVYSKEMSHNLQNLAAPHTANWTLIFVADFAQYQWRYRHERALRNIYLESGRLGQRLLMAGMIHRLGTLPTPASRDKDVSELLCLDPVRQAPIYTLTMGPYRRSENE